MRGNKRKSIGFLLAVVLTIFGALALSLTSGCAHFDPLGTPAQGEKGEADYPTRGGVICREVYGKLGLASVDAYGQGFRCLDVGTQGVEGCIKYDDGRFEYTSPGCANGPGQ